MRQEARHEMALAASSVPNDLEPYWMPFTANRAFKARPRLVVGAKDIHYFTSDGRKLIDGSAGLWCTNAGHNRDPIVQAIQAQAAELDYAPAFQFGHPKAFELASRVAALAPGDLDHVFFCNSGSEAVDTALKIALAFHNVRGNASRVRLIGRERGYHGVGFGGVAVGGIVNNRKQFGALIAGVDHLPMTYNREKQAFTIGEPEWGAHLADELDRLVALHDASTIAAVIVEPVAASTGVLPPPKGYLERLRAICDKHGILLIFDEVITGYGRLGFAFAAERYGVVPDMITFAKGVTSGAVPMGGVIVRKGIYDAFMKGPEHVIELFHGYTLFGTSARLRRRACDARCLPRRRPVRARSQARKALGTSGDGAQGPAERARYPHGWPHRRDRSREQARCRRQARHGRARSRFLRARRHVPRGRRYDRAQPAIDRERKPDRRDVRQARPYHQSRGLNWCTGLRYINIKPSLIINLPA
jgi:beta-alanine--pyruvate transaminase